MALDESSGTLWTTLGCPLPVVWYQSGERKIFWPAPAKRPFLQRSHLCFWFQHIWVTEFGQMWTFFDRSLFFVLLITERCNDAKVQPPPTSLLRPLEPRWLKQTNRTVSCTAWQRSYKCALKCCRSCAFKIYCVWICPPTKPAECYWSGNASAACVFSSHSASSSSVWIDVLFAAPRGLICE